MPLVLYGCVAQPVSVDIDTDVSRGHIVARPGRAGFVVAAPHGSSDIATGDMAADIAQRTGFGLVVATGFSIAADTRDGSARRFQVNRPFEGVPGRPPGEERATAAARQVYGVWQQRVQEAAQGRLAFYAEIHGNNRGDASDRIEIATVGIDREYAARLRTLLELIRDAHRRARPDMPKLAILVEPADTVRYGASGAKRDGILRLPERAVHVELPQSARTDWRASYTAILAEFLAQAATLPAGR